MKGKDNIKKKGGLERKGSEIWEKNTVALRTVLVIKFKKYIQELISSDCVKDSFSLEKTSLSLLSYYLDPLHLLPNSLEPSFSTHSLQIHCIGIFGPKFIYPLG